MVIFDLMEKRFWVDRIRLKHGRVNGSFLIERREFEKGKEFKFGLKNTL